MVEWAVLAVMAVSVVLQIMIVIKPSPQKQIDEAFRLLDDTLRMQAATLNELIYRMRNLEQRINALQLPQPEEDSAP